MNVTSFLVQFGLAAVFVTAATAKWFRIEDFGSALRMSHLPEWSIKPISAVVPAVEATMALVLLVSPPSILPIAFLAAASLLLTFTVWVAWVIVRRLSPRCACFGANSAEVGARTLLRNALLIVAAIAGSVSATKADAVELHTSSSRVITATCFVLVVALLCALRVTWPALVLSAAKLAKVTDQFSPQRISREEV